VQIVARLCRRPGCGNPASVTLGFDAGRRVVWFDAVASEGTEGAAGPAGPTAGDLCQRHAATMVVPKGWSLDDRRTELRLFPVADPDHGPTPSAPPAAAARTPAPRTEGAPARPRVHRSRDHAAAPASTEPLPFDRAGNADAAHWTPRFDQTDDLDGLLDAQTPLLRRAFGRRPRSG